MRVTIITDASFCPNAHVGGYGYWIASNRKRIAGGGAFKNQISTSVHAEIFSIVNALWAGIKSNCILDGDEVLIQTDCITAIETFTTKRKNLSKQETDAITYFNMAKEEQNLTINFRHVKGHSSVGNNRSISQRNCDRVAKDHMRTQRIKYK